jgi:hypothetical protein
MELVGLGTASSDMTCHWRLLRQGVELMPRRMLNVLVEGLTITAVVVAFLATSAKIVRPAPLPPSTSAQDLRGLAAQRLGAGSLQPFFAVGGAESLDVTPRSQPDVRQFFQPATPRTFYPGTISPLPEDLFKPDQLPNALKLIEVPMR